MEWLQAIWENPDNAALIVAFAWIYSLMRDLGHLRARLERVYDRQEIIWSKLVGKVTETDIGEV